MKEFAKPTITTLHNLLDYDATKFTNAEIQLKYILPVWLLKASSMKLKEMIQKYQDYTEEHIESFNKFFESEDINALSTNNRIMKAMIEEIEEKMGCCTDHEVKDASLLAGIQMINHYKISLYGTAAAFARTLGNENAAGIFHVAEANEKLIDDRLNQLAKFEVNKKAVAPIALTQ